MKPPPRWLRRAPLIREPLRRAAKRWGPKGPIDTTRDGLAFRLAPRDNKVDFDIWYKKRLNEVVERAFLMEHLRPGEWFIDVGANIGLYTISVLAGVEGARAVAFEPLDRLRARLDANIHLNGLSDRVSVRAEAVGPEGEMQLYESRNAGRSSLLPFDGARPGRIVPVRPLHQVLRELDVRASAIKIDIEGFESDALMPFFDATPPHEWPRALVIETLHRGLWKRDCLTELAASTYVLDGETDENALLVRRTE
ncbi:MAG: FkbM family methyltransferase [Pseudomonadota bacterium]